MLSIADDTGSIVALDAGLEFIGSLEGFWANHKPQFVAAAASLLILEESRLEHPKLSEGRAKLKGSLLRNLLPSYNCADIVAVADYSSQSKLWTAEDQNTLIDKLEEYLEQFFYAELADISEEEELWSLSRNIRGLSITFGLDVDTHQDAISNRMREFVQPEEEDEHESPVREWNNERQPSSAQTEEDQLRGLFDGLR
jgi:hypothetical protein